MPGCATCESENRELLEHLGEQALYEKISWRQAAREAGLTHHAGLKNHMERHWVAPEVQQLKDHQRSVQEELEEAVKAGVAELLERARTSLPDVRPLLLQAAFNLQHLLSMKPSQAALTDALKKIQDITGMKQEQRLLHEFAAAAFPKAVQATHKPVLELEAVDSSDG